MKNSMSDNYCRVGTDDYIYSIIITITVGAVDNGLPSSLSACSRVKAQEIESIDSNPSHSSTSLIVHGIDVYDSDIVTLAPQTMVNDTIVNILFVTLLTNVNFNPN